MVESLGLVFFGIVFFVFLVIVGFILKNIFLKNKFVQKVLLFCYNKIVFNFFIRSFIAGYLVWAISCFMNLLNLDFTSPIEAFSSVLAIITAIWCWTCPFLTTLIII